MILGRSFIACGAAAIVLVGCVEPRGLVGDAASDTGSADGTMAADAIVDAPMDRPAVGEVGVGKDNGISCNVGNECKAGNCVEGVCCDDACGIACNSCLNANTGKPDGQCAPVKAGLTHAGDCTATPAATCGLDGKCDGAGACRFHLAGITCAGESCTNGAQVSRYNSARTCNGSGVCSPATASDCGSAYRCDGTTCRTTCTGPQDCVPGDYCAGSTSACLAKKPDGSLCSSASECAAGMCGGRCCAVGCTCTQPGPSNLMQNPGIDQDASNWTIDMGALTRSATDSENCPYSGSLFTTLEAGAAERTIRQCVHNMPLAGAFNGGLQARVFGGPGSQVICQVNFYADLDCAGDLVVQNETASATSRLEWQPLTTTIGPVTGAYSVGFACYLLADQSMQTMIYLDGLYISIAPGHF